MEIEKFLLDFGDPFRRAVTVVRPLQSADLDVFEQQIIGLNDGDVAGGKADDDHAPAPAASARRARIGRAADRIDDDVGAMPARELANEIAQAVMDITAAQ